jgi:hypothetical protein
MRFWTRKDPGKILLVGLREPLESVVQNQSIFSATGLAVCPRATVNILVNGNVLPTNGLPMVVGDIFSRQETCLPLGRSVAL